MDAEGLIEWLGLRPHPEGGWFVETWREPTPAGQRAASTAIFFLLRRGENSHWHRVDATEVWHFYAGDALALWTAATDDVPASRHVLGRALEKGERPQLVVPANHWQSAASLGEWTLVGCTVAPGFEFDGFELARPGWAPGADAR